MDEVAVLSCDQSQFEDQVYTTEQESSMLPAGKQGEGLTSSNSNPSSQEITHQIIKNLKVMYTCTTERLHFGESKTSARAPMTGLSTGTPTPRENKRDLKVKDLQRSTSNTCSTGEEGTAPDNEEKDQHVNFDEARTLLAKSNEETALDCVCCPEVQVRTDMEANTDMMDHRVQKDAIKVSARTEWTGIKGILPLTVEWKVTLLSPMKPKASSVNRWEASDKEFRKVWGYFDGASRDKLNAHLLSGSGRPPGCSTNHVYSTLLKRKY
jgi:hypothetical protein